MLWPMGVPMCVLDALYNVFVDIFASPDTTHPDGLERGEEEEPDKEG